MNKGAASKPKVACLVNPCAANSKWERRARLRAYLQRTLPGRCYDITGDRDNTVRLAKQLSQEADVIVAIGGDGTVADVIQGIFESGREKEVVLGIIPFGSGNGFRKSLDLPKSPRKAIRRLAEGVVREMDVFCLENRYGGFASVGATAEITQKKLEGKIHGLFGHVVASRKFLTIPLKEKTVELEEGIDDQGRPFEHLCFQTSFFDCVVAKTNYFGYGWAIAPKAKVDDGYLDITLFEVSPVKYLFLFPLIYFGWFQRTQRHFKAKKIRIRGKALPVQYHGEVLGERDEVEFKVLPKALKVICPAGKKRKFWTESV